MMTKPYAASGRYIDRMSHFCGDCRYKPTAHGRRRVPGHAALLGLHGAQRRALERQPPHAQQVQMLARIDDLDEVRAGAERVRRAFGR